MPQTDQAYNQQLQTMHALALQGKLRPNLSAVTSVVAPGTTSTTQAPSNPAAMAVKPPMGTKAPITPPKTPTDAGFQSKPGASDPASIGGSMMNPGQTVSSMIQQGNQPTTNAGTTSSAGTTSPAGTSSATSAFPSYADQLKALQDAQAAYVKSTALSPDILDTQNQLNAIAAKQAALQASEKAGEANVQDLPIAMSLVGGQQASLQRQLAALQGQQAALATPLQQKLALAQMQRQAAMQGSEAQANFAQQNLQRTLPVSVTPGNALVNPLTGQAVYQGLGLQGKNAVDTFYNLQQTYPDVGIKWDSSKSPEDNLAAAEAAAAKSPNYTAKANSFSAVQLPGGGLGVINTKQGAGSLNTVVSPAAGAGARADQASLAQQQLYADTVQRSFNTANDNLKQLTGFMTQNGINQSTVPIENQLENRVKAGLTDAGTIAAFHSAIQGLRSEYAQVLARGGSVTDTERNSAAQLIPDNISPAQLQQVADRLNVEGQNAINEAKSQVQAIQERMSGQTQGAYATSDGTQYVQGPDGLYYPKAEGGAGTPVSAINIPKTSHLAYVNNNPGNLRFAGQAGATQGEGGFAKFSSPQAGYEALRQQIDLDTSRGLTLQQFISKYAPPSENDTNLYIRQVAQATGLNPYAPLTPQDADKLARAIAMKESSTNVG